MALVNLKEMLEDASRRKYAVGSFNVINLESLHGILEAAVLKRSPVILSIAEVHFKYLDLETIAEVAKLLLEK
jgi:fructose-bisphosphate aldolase class II